MLRRLVENLSDSGDSLAAMQIASQADVNRPDLQAIVLGRTFGSQSKEEQAALLSMVRPEDLDEVIELTLFNIFIWSSESAAYQLVQSLGDGSGADHAWSELSSHLLRHGTPETALESALRISNSERREAGVADAVVASIAAGQNADSVMGSLADRLEPFELQGVLRKTVDELAWRARSGKASDLRLAAEAPALVARLSDPQEADRARRRLIPAAALIGDRLTLEALLAAVEDPWYRDFGLAEAVELLADAGALEPARELAGRIERRTERNRALASFSRRALRQPGPEGAALARTALEEITRQMPADIQDEIWETLALFEFTLGLAGLGELEEAESVVGQLDRRSWHRSDGLIEILGGNQSDTVKVSRYASDRLLGVRRIA